MMLECTDCGTFFLAYRGVLNCVTREPYGLQLVVVFLVDLSLHSTHI